MFRRLHPGKLTWNLNNHPFENEKHLNQTFIFRVPCSFSGVDPFILEAKNGNFSRVNSNSLWKTSGCTSSDAILVKNWLPGSRIWNPLWWHLKRWNPWRIHGTNGIFTYIWLIFMVNVGKYAIHGYYGKWWNDVERVRSTSPPSCFMRSYREGFWWFHTQCLIL